MLRMAYSTASKKKAVLEVEEEENAEQVKKREECKQVEKKKKIDFVEGGRRYDDARMKGKSYMDDSGEFSKWNNNGKDDGPRFKDFGGIKGTLDQLLKEVIYPHYHWNLTQYLGFKPLTGLLLCGPPGCGKTMLAHAIANETGFPFYYVSAPQLASDASQGNVTELFSKARRTSPSIIFIDEIDAIASDRRERRTDTMVVTELMTCMSEPQQIKNSVDAETDSRASDRRPGFVLVIGATNLVDALDPAVRRPGRFDREIFLGYPDENARFEILSLVTQNLRLEGTIDLRKLAKSTLGFVGADLTELANKAGNLALIKLIDGRKLEPSGKPEDEGNNEQSWTRPWTPEEAISPNVTMADFEEALTIVQPSTRRKGFSTIPNVKWEDVGGLDWLREEFLWDIIDRIKYPEDYEGFGVETGFLLYGPPGCGKTRIAEAVANESGATFIYIKGPELLSKYVGESEKRISEVFNRASTCSPCIIFFDEVDAITAVPKEEREGGRQVLAQLLTELDGAYKRRGVFVIGATNRPHKMDPAARRPGRFGKLICVPLPGPDERGLILKALARNTRIDEDIDLVSFGRKEACENLSGADLAQLLVEANKLAVKEHRMLGHRSPDTKRWTIKQIHIEQALEKISPSVSDEQRRHYERLSRELV